MALREDAAVQSDLRRAALAHVWLDLEATAPGLLTIEERDDMIVLRQPDGSGVGLPERWEEAPAGEVELLVVHAVQEAAIEALWARTGSAVWPNCPDHPGTHPLGVTQGPPLFWVCPGTTRSVAEVGQLARRG